MTRHLRTALCFLCLAAHASKADLPTASPEEAGWDSAPLVAMFDFVRERKIPVHSLQIVRHGRLVLDAYFYPYSPGTRHDVASVTKSLTSTLVGLAMDKRLLAGPQQTIVDLFPHRAPARLDARKRKLTIEHLLTMQAGWDCGFEAKEARLFEMRGSADWVQFMLDLPMMAEPGTRWAYCSGNCHLLSAILTKATGTNMLAFARRELFGPIGIQDVAWPADAYGNNHGWGDLQLHPRDMARLGQLFLQKGRWKDEQLLSEGWIRAATRSHVKKTSNNDHYGYFWWVKGKDYPGMFEAVGRGGQRISVWPAKDLVVVFTGGGLEPGDLAPFILKALEHEKASPKSDASSRQLEERLAAAAKPPLPQPVPRSPSTAARISGKTFRLSGASFGTLSLDFNDSSEAQAALTWENRRVSFPVGLDNVERFSTNPLVGLPQAAKGRWLDGATFLLDLDLVGGINHYLIKLSFTNDAKNVNVAMRELTGLSDEHFTGKAAE